MQIAKDGYLRWFFWAFFSWKGRIKRLPFAGATFCLMLFQVPYLSFAIQFLAVYIVPPADGSFPTPAYASEMGRTMAMIPFMLPIALLRFGLDIKRLRSIGAPLAIAAVFGVLFLISPIFTPGITEMINMTTIAYLGILAILPAKEDRMSSLERKHRAWQSLATGDGTPRRLSGKDILSWKVVRKQPKE